MMHPAHGKAERKPLELPDHPPWLCSGTARSIHHGAGMDPARMETTMTQPLPHQTPHGPLSTAGWTTLLATAPRGADSVGRPTIQVCTAADGRAIWATVDYAIWRAAQDEG
jgi:hypothetical protein